MFNIILIILHDRHKFKTDIIAYMWQIYTCNYFFSDDWSLMPGNTDAETEAESDSDSQRSRRRAPASISPVLISSESETDVPPPSSLPTPLPPNRPKRPGTSQPSDVSSDSLLNLMTEMMSSSSISDDDANKTLVADEPGPSTGRPVRKTRMRTDKVCHPAGFKELQPKSKPGTTPKGKGKGKKKATDNPYSKSAFIWSDDDDFVLWVKNFSESVHVHSSELVHIEWILYQLI